jgi:hypothetical protein
VRDLDNQAQPPVITLHLFYDGVETKATPYGVTNVTIAHTFLALEAESEITGKQK